MRVLKDGTGAHDLDQVVSVSPRPTTKRGGDPGPTWAVLHFTSGSAVQTATDYETAVALWAPQKKTPAPAESGEHEA